ncbi:MAG: hypothetical protein WC965_01875 [Thiohalomonadaceae bacterium]
MANQLYAKAREKFLTGTLAWTTTGTAYKVALVNTEASGYNTPDFAEATDFSTEVPAGVVGTAVSVTVGTDTYGTATIPAGSTEFTNVTGNLVGAIIIYDDTSGQPVVYIDEGFNPILPNGGNITILWDGGTGNVFKL